MKDYADRGGYYPPRPMTPSEVCIILYILRKPQSLSALLSQNMLTFVEVKFTSIVHVQKTKGCSGLEIYSKWQMLSTELSSCYVFSQQFVVKRIKCSADCSTIFLFFTKTTQPLLQVFLVKGASTCTNVLHFCCHRLVNRKILQNVVNIVAGNGELCLCFQPIRNGEKF